MRGETEAWDGIATLELHPLDRLVAMALRRWADETGTCRPSHAAVARLTGLSERRVQIAMRHLEEAGVVRCIARASGGRGGPRIIQIWLPTVGQQQRTPCAVDASERAHAAPEGRTVCADGETERAHVVRERAHHVRNKGARSAPELLQRTRPRTREERIPPAASGCADAGAARPIDAKPPAPMPAPSDAYVAQPDIAAAWEHVPTRLRRGLGRFRAAWVQARRDHGVPAETLIAQLAAYYASPEGRGRFARQPARFLADEGWAESPEAWANDGGDDRGAGPQETGQQRAARMLAELDQARRDPNFLRLTGSGS